MALWNKKPGTNPQLGDLAINEMSMTEMALNHSEAERIYREGLLSPTVISSRRVTASPYPYSRPMSDLANERHRKNMLAMRLRISEGEHWGFDSLHTSLGKEKVFVFVVQDGKTATLEDDASMFPSDTLITQLRLIQK